MVLAMEGKTLLEFRDKFPNFRNSIKNSKNFYRFNLVLARLKLTGKIWYKIYFCNIFRTYNSLRSIEQNLFHNFSRSNESYEKN
jgi:hypothetical protein